MKNRSIVFSLALAHALAACGGSEPNDPAASHALGQELEGTWDFVLDASDVAATLRAGCGGDAACWAGVQREASTEKIRFATSPEGHVVWTSFAREGDREEVFVEVPISVARGEPNVIVAKGAGWPKGTLVGQVTHLRTTMRIERRDDGTIAVVDPQKGRLVYRRSG